MVNRISIIFNKIYKKIKHSRQSPAFIIATFVYLSLLILSTTIIIQSIYPEYSLSLTLNGLNVFVDLLRVPIGLSAAYLAILTIIISFTKMKQFDNQLIILQKQIHEAKLPRLVVEQHELNVKNSVVLNQSGEYEIQTGERNADLRSREIKIINTGNGFAHNLFVSFFFDFDNTDLTFKELFEFLNNNYRSSKFRFANYNIIDVVEEYSTGGIYFSEDHYTKNYLAPFVHKEDKLVVRLPSNLVVLHTLFSNYLYHDFLSKQNDMSISKYEFDYKKVLDPKLGVKKILPTLLMQIHFYDVVSEWNLSNHYQLEFRCDQFKQSLIGDGLIVPSNNHFKIRIYRHGDRDPLNMFIKSKYEGKHILK